MKTNLPIVVIGQNYCTSLGIIKALGEAGYRCEVGKRVFRKPRLYSPEMKSRYIDKAIYLQTAPDGEMLKSIIENFSIPHIRKILIPSDDYCAALIDRHLDELAEYFILPNVNNEQGGVGRLMNKRCQNELAEKHGITVADSVIIKVIPGHEIVIPDNTPYPCLIKPIESAEYSKSYIQKCENKEELISTISKTIKEQECTLLAEQFIEIEKEYTIPGLAINSDVIIPAVIEKLRTGDGNHKGVTISGVVKNSNIIGDIVEKLKSLVRETGFQGIFDIELLQSRNELLFNEINLRNGAAGYSLTMSGINIPALYADYLLNKEVSLPIEKFTPGFDFVNEKAALENYLSGFSSFRVLIRTIKNAEIRFLLRADDMKACATFCLLSVCLIIKKFIMHK